MMRRGPIIFSALAHAMLLIIAIIGLPFAKPAPIVIPPPPVVDIVDISEVTQTTKVSATPSSKPDKTSRTTKKKPQRTAMKPPAPRSKPKPPSMPKPPSLEQKPPEARKPEQVKAKTPDAKAEPEQKTPAPTQTSKSFDEMMAGIPGLIDKSPDKPEVEEGHNVPIGARMTISESDALRRQLESCWNVPLGARDAQDLVVNIFMEVNPDRTVREARVVDMQRYSRDGFYRAAADSALRAVQSPQCSPLALPPDKYEEWRHITVTFDPRNMF